MRWGWSGKGPRTWQAEVGRLGSDLTAAEAEGEAQSALIATLRGQLAAREGELAAATARITSFEAQVASLLAERDAARGEVERAGCRRSAELEAEQARLLSAGRGAAACARQGARGDRRGHRGGAAGRGADRGAEPADRRDEGKGGRSGTREMATSADLISQARSRPN